MMPYRFFHSADIHLDSPLRSLALRDTELADLIGNATRRAFANLRHHVATATTAALQYKIGRSTVIVLDT
jgi:hypothetical protein